MPRGIGAYDEARLQGRLWTPDLLGPRVKAWYEVEQSSGTSGLITSARDLSGNGINLTGSVGISSYKNGKQIWTTDGFTSGQYLQGNLTLTGTAPVSFFISAFASNAGTSYSRLLSVGVFNVNDFDRVSAISILREGGNQNMTSFWNGNTRGLVPFVYDVPFMMSVVYDGVNCTIGLDGKYATPSAAAHDLAVTTIRLAANVNSGDASYWFGGVSSAIVVQGAISAQEKAQLEGYSAWSRGTRLAANHPFANRPPLIGD
jgi:hypothetical protein